MHFRMRLFSVLLAVMMLGVVMLGSYSEIQWPQQETEEEELWTSKKETIYVWYVDETLGNYLNSAAVSFGESEGVRVIPVLKSTSTLLEDINAATMDAEKQTPDAYIINNDELEKAYLAGLATEIQNQSGLVNEAWFPKASLDAVTCNGKTVAYPFYFETCVLVYNKDYVELWLRQQEDRSTEEELQVDAEAGEEAEVYEDQEVNPLAEDAIGEDGIPTTVGGLLQFADTFDAPEGVDGVMKWDVADIFYNYWIVGAYLNVGGECGDDENNITVYSEEIVNCLEVYQALNQFFYIEPETVDYESAMQDFIDGKLVFTIGTTQSLAQLQDATEDGSFNFRYGFAKIPHINMSLQSRPLSVTDAVAINGYSEHKDLANRFAEYVTRVSASELYARSGKMASSYVANRERDDLTIFIDQYADSISLPKMMEIGNLWLQLEALFAKVWNGEEVLPLVQELEKQINEQLGAE